MSAQGVGPIGAIAVGVGSVLGAVGNPVLEFVGHPAPEALTLGPNVTLAEQEARRAVWAEEANTHRIASIAVGAILVFAGVAVIAAIARRFL